ncbi:MAG: hypothetical protein INH34_12120 [Phycisphaerales bacterium]|nr:hypothetical protein [Phycisphaerales bacterium]
MRSTWVMHLALGSLLAACAASSAARADAGFYVFDPEASAAAMVALRPEAERDDAALQRSRALAHRVRQGFVELLADGSFLSHLTVADTPVLAARGTWRRENDVLRLVAVAPGQPELVSDFRSVDDVLALQRDLFGNDVVLIYRRTPAAPR